MNHRINRLPSCGRPRALPGLLIAFLLGLAGMASAEDATWLHVRVQDGEETVKLNLPLSAVQALIPALGHEHLQDGRLKLPSAGAGSVDVDVAAALRAVRQMPDGEWLRVEGAPEQVTIRREQGYLRIEVREPEIGALVQVRLPMEVLDAFDQAEPPALDLSRALEILQRYPGLELVQVDEKDTRVRIWLDRTPNPES